MARVYLGVGSSIERERYIVAGLDALQGLFGQVALSSVYDSEAIGFAGQPFLNLVAGVDTLLSPGQLLRQLRQIEVEHGRRANATRFSARQLDIDILTHGQLTGTVEGVELPRPRSWRMRLCCAHWRSWPARRCTPPPPRPTSNCGRATIGIRSNCKRSISGGADAGYRGPERG